MVSCFSGIYSRIFVYGIYSILFSIFSIIANIRRVVLCCKNNWNCTIYSAASTEIDTHNRRTEEESSDDNFDCDCDSENSIFFFKNYSELIKFWCQLFSFFFLIFKLIFECTNFTHFQPFAEGRRRQSRQRSFGFFVLKQTQSEISATFTKAHATNTNYKNWKFFEKISQTANRRATKAPQSSWRVCSAKNRTGRSSALPLLAARSLNRTKPNRTCSRGLLWLLPPQQQRESSSSYHPLSLSRSPANSRLSLRPVSIIVC